MAHSLAILTCIFKARLRSRYVTWRKLAYTGPELESWVGMMYNPILIEDISRQIGSVVRCHVYVQPVLKADRSDYVLLSIGKLSAANLDLRVHGGRGCNQ